MLSLDTGGNRGGQASVIAMPRRSTSCRTRLAIADDCSPTVQRLALDPFWNSARRRPDHLGRVFALDGDVRPSALKL